MIQVSYYVNEKRYDPLMFYCTPDCDLFLDSIECPIAKYDYLSGELIGKYMPNDLMVDEYYSRFIGVIKMNYIKMIGLIISITFMPLDSVKTVPFQGKSYIVMEASNQIRICTIRICTIVCRRLNRLYV